MVLLGAWLPRPTEGNPVPAPTSVPDPRLSPMALHADALGCLPPLATPHTPSPSLRVSGQLAGAFTFLRAAVLVVGFPEAPV